MFKEYPTLRVEISGHTSNEGKRDFNMKLSRKRAEAVKLFLVSAGIDETRIGTVGYGPDKPIADNETKDGKEKNRRIEFRLLGTQEKVQTQPEPEDINPSPDRDAKPAKGKAKAKAGAGEDAGQAEGEGKGQEGEGGGARRRSDAVGEAGGQGKGRARRQGRAQGEGRPRRQGRPQGQSQGSPQGRALSPIRSRSPREGDPIPSPRVAGRGLGRGGRPSGPALLRERRKHGAAARVRPLVFLRVACGAGSRQR